MSKNLTRKGLALVSGLALAVSSMVGIAAPAYAAGEVTLKPSTGTGSAAFTTDPFSLTATVQTAVVASANLAFKIDNPDQHQLLITTTATGGTAIGITATGSTVAMGTFTNGNMIIDFKDDNLTSVVLHTFTDIATRPISIKLDNKAGQTGLEDSVAGSVELAYGARTADAKISVQSWVEVSATADYTTVDSSYASDVVDVTFVDPKNVSVISEVVRSKANGQPVSYLADVDAHATTNVNIAALDTLDIGAEVDGHTLILDDRILLSGQTNPAENGIYIAGAGGAAGTPSAVAADAATFPSAGVGVLVTGANPNSGRFTLLGTAGADLTANAPGTVFATHLNEVGDKYLTANLRFSRADINLNQVDITQWKYGVVSSQANDGFALEAVTLRDANTAWAKGTKNVEIVQPVGHSASNFGTYGNILIRGGVTGDALTANKTYQVRFAHDSTDAPVFQSPAFTTVSNGVAATAVAVTSIVTSTTDATAGANPTLRAGTKAFTYRAQAKVTGGNPADVKTANIPMVAVVQAGAFMPTGESIFVSGSTKTITRSNDAVIVAGLTDSNGRFSVTVTSTTAAAAQGYSVTFSIGDGADDGTFVAAAAPIKATYAAAAPNSVSITPAIASSSSVNMKVAVVDQFGQPISTRGTAPLNVELKAPDKTKLEQFAAVVDGAANFSFENYLSAAGSDVLTVRVFTGSSTSPTYVTALDSVVSLFAPVAVAAINVAPEVTGVVVEYVDFIEGKSTTAKPGPSANSKTYAGTVVNDNGAGIAGAGVTIAADGFQFKVGTDYYMDSVTLATDAAGSFSVEYWTTVASATGQIVTVTSGTATATTKVKSATPAAMSPANLSFSWDIPATLVMNTTYAVTATVTDKHGNGMAGAQVTFSGFGSATFNGLPAAARDTDRNGKAIAFLRSLKDVDGVSAVGVVLNDLGATTLVVGTTLADVLTDVATTAYDESKWSNTIDAQVNFLKTAPAASAAAGKVNVGSFNGKLVVYAVGLDGAKISWKVAGKWGVANASGDALNRFDRPVGASGVNVLVDIYVNGVKQLSKSVLTR